MNTMSFYDFRPGQAQVLEVNLFQKYVKNLSEWENKFLSSYYREKCSNAYKIRKSVSLD